MTHIGGRQIRAARALLDISQDELAKATGLTPQSIRKIESGDVQPREGTMTDITRALSERGVEFVEDRGVALRNDAFATIMGPDAFVRVLDDVILTLKNEPGAEALFSCVCDRMSPPIVVDNYRRLRRAGIKMRSLIQEGDTYVMGKLEEYRCLPKPYFHNNTNVIYKSKVATMLLDPVTGQDMGVIITNNPSIATVQKNLFNLVWSQSHQPTQSTADQFYDE